MYKDVVSKYNEILLNHKKKIMSFAATRMDLEIIIPSEVRVKYHVTSFVSGI